MKSRQVISFYYTYLETINEYKNVKKTYLGKKCTSPYINVETIGKYDFFSSNLQVQVISLAYINVEAIGKYKKCEEKKIQI